MLNYDQQKEVDLWDGSNDHRSLFIPHLLEQDRFEEIWVFGYPYMVSKLIFDLTEQGRYNISDPMATPVSWSWTSYRTSKMADTHNRHRGGTIPFQALDVDRITRVALNLVAALFLCGTLLEEGLATLALPRKHAADE